MNDLEYRRRIYINPRDKSDEILKKQGMDDNARQFGEEMRELEDLLEDVIKVDPSTTSIDQVLQNQFDRSSSENQQYSFPRRSIFAIAATVLLAFGLVTAAWFERDDDIGALVMEHINEELEYLSFSELFPNDSVRAVVKLVGGDITHKLENVLYAGLCQIRNSISVHLLLKGKKGIVTVLLMPGNQLERAITIDDPRFQGLITANGSGSIAVIGEEGEPILDVLNVLNQSLVWES